MKVKFVFLIILFILCSSAEIPADTYTIDGSTVHQSIDGFGASSFEMTSLTEAQADKFFSITNGIGLSFLRMKITGAGGTSETSIAQQAVARGARVWAAPWSLLHRGKPTMTLTMVGIFLKHVTRIGQIG